MNDKDVETLNALKIKRAAILLDKKDPDEVIGDAQREKEMKDRSYLEEVKTVFSLRSEK